MGAKPFYSRRRERGGARWLGRVCRLQQHLLLVCEHGRSRGQSFVVSVPMLSPLLQGFVSPIHGGEPTNTVSYSNMPAKADRLGRR